MSRASSSPDADFLDSFLEHVSETGKKRSSQKLTLDKPVLPAIAPIVSPTQSFGSIHNEVEPSKSSVSWKRNSKLVTEVPGRV